MQAVEDTYSMLTGCSLLPSRCFRKSRNILERKARLLRESVKRKRPDKSDSFFDDKVNKRWKCGQFGIDCPVALINILLRLLTLHFGFRGLQEYHDMQIEVFTCKAKPISFVGLRTRPTLF